MPTSIRKSTTARRTIPSAPASPLAVVSTDDSLTIASEEETPTSRGLEDEQLELHSLNERLETCMMRQRAKDENEVQLRHEMDHLRAYFEEEIDKLSRSHEDTLMIVRTKRNQLGEENKILSAKIRPLENSIASMTNANEQLHNRNKVQQQEMNKLLKINEQLVSEIHQLKTSLKSIKKDLARAEYDRQSSLEELQKQTKQDDRDSVEALKQKLQLLQEDYDNKNAALNKERQESRRERQKHTMILDEKAKEIREELNMKMMEMCKQRQESFNEKLLEFQDKLGQEYNMQLQLKSDQLQSALDNLGEAVFARSEMQAKLEMIENDPDRQTQTDQSNRIQTLQKMLNTKDKEHRQSVKQLTKQGEQHYNKLALERDTLKMRIEQLEAKLNSQDKWEDKVADLTADLDYWKQQASQLTGRAPFQKDLKTTVCEQEALLKGLESRIKILQEHISNSNEEMHRKNEEYESLLGLKISLDLEIKSYSWLLENEETRLGIKSQKRKRELVHDPKEIASPMSTQTARLYSTLASPTSATCPSISQISRGSSLP